MALAPALPMAEAAAPTHGMVHHQCSGSLAQCRGHLCWGQMGSERLEVRKLKVPVWVEGSLGTAFFLAQRCSVQTQPLPHSAVCLPDLSHRAVYGTHEAGTAWAGQAGASAQPGKHHSKAGGWCLQPLPASAEQGWEAPGCGGCQGVGVRRMSAQSGALREERGCGQRGNYSCEKQK